MVETYADICSVVRALEEVVSRGLAEYYGLSNYGVSELEKALSCIRKIEPVSNQVQYSLAYRVVENRLKTLMEKEKLGLIAWSPLARGVLAGVGKPQTKAQRYGVFEIAVRDKQLQEALEREAGD